MLIHTHSSGIMKNVDDKNPRKFDYVLGQILNINNNEIKNIILISIW